MRTAWGRSEGRSWEVWGCMTDSRYCAAEGGLRSGVLGSKEAIHDVGTPGLRRAFS